MKKILITILILTYLTIYPQKNKIDFIYLEYIDGIYFGTNHNIKISFYNDGYKNSDVHIRTIIDDKKNIKNNISMEKFDLICEKLLSIVPYDIIKEAPVYLDASTTNLTFGVYSNHVTYSVSGLSKGDENTCRKQFLEVVKMILEIAEIKIRYIN